MGYLSELSYCKKHNLRWALDVTANGRVSFLLWYFWFIFQSNFIFSLTHPLLPGGISLFGVWTTNRGEDSWIFDLEYFKLCAYFLHHRRMFSVSEVKSPNSAALHGIFPRLTCKSIVSRTAVHHFTSCVTHSSNGFSVRLFQFLIFIATISHEWWHFSTNFVCS